MTTYLRPGQRVHHRSFGPGRVSGRPMSIGTLRVRFDSGSQPLVRAEDLLPVPDGLEPVFSDAGDVSDYARLIHRPGFAVEDMMLVADEYGERVVWIGVEGETPWLNLNQTRELVQVLQGIIDAAEG